MSTFYTHEELSAIGLKSFGENVKISRKASLYNPQRIEIGNNVRIDDFCVMSACSDGFIKIGNHVHIAAFCFIEAPAGIVFEDFSGLAARCTIYGGSDDYSGNHLTNPCVPDSYRKCQKGLVTLKKHAVVGSGSTIILGVTLGEGSAVGSMSLVMKDISPSTIAIGIPAVEVKTRSKKLFDLEEKLKI